MRRGVLLLLLLRVVVGVWEMVLGKHRVQVQQRWRGEGRPGLARW